MREKEHSVQPEESHQSAKNLAHPTSSQAWVQIYVPTASIICWIFKRKFLKTELHFDFCRKAGIWLI